MAGNSTLKHTNTIELKAKYKEKRKRGRIQVGAVLVFRKGTPPEYWVVVAVSYGAPAVYWRRVGVFDTIDHDILFHRLEHVFGIQNSALSFF